MTCKFRITPSAGVQTAKSGIGKKKVASEEATVFRIHSN